MCHSKEEAGSHAIDVVVYLDQIIEFVAADPFAIFCHPSEDYKVSTFVLVASASSLGELRIRAVSPSIPRSEQRRENGLRPTVPSCPRQRERVLTASPAAAAS